MVGTRVARGLAAALTVAALAAMSAAFAQGRTAAPSPATTTPASEALKAAGSDRAVLVRGTISVRGLPFFSVNAIAALTGEYVLPAAAAPAVEAPSAGAPAAGASVPVWYTKESLVFGGEWRRTTIGGATAYIMERTIGPVLALQATRYSLFLEIPSDSPVFRAFAASFSRRFAFFFGAARDEAEISFPAYIDLRG